MLEARCTTEQGKYSKDLMNLNLMVTNQYAVKEDSLLQSTVRDSPRKAEETILYIPDGCAVPQTAEIQVKQ